MSHRLVRWCCQQLGDARCRGVRCSQSPECDRAGSIVDRRAARPRPAVPEVAAPPAEPASFSVVSTMAARPRAPLPRCASTSRWREGMVIAKRHRAGDLPARRRRQSAKKRSGRAIPADGEARAIAGGTTTGSRRPPSQRGAPNRARHPKRRRHAERRARSAPPPIVTSAVTSAASARRGARRAARAAARPAAAIASGRLRHEQQIDVARELQDAETHRRARGPWRRNRARRASPH